MIDKTDESGILVTLDEDKAFERVDHTFLMKVLIKFAFGPSFRVLFESFPRIICNGRLIDAIYLE